MEGIKMKLSKRQLRRIISEEKKKLIKEMDFRDAYNPENFYDKILDMETDLAELKSMSPFRSPGVRAALHELEQAYEELLDGMNQELDHIRATGD